MKTKTLPLKNIYFSLTASALTLLSSFFLLLSSVNAQATDYLKAGLTAPTVTTDKEDYLPGETAHITGTGWALDRTVHVEFKEEPVYPEYAKYDASVNIDGTWKIEFPIVQRHLGVKFSLTAIGLTSKASAEKVFRDGVTISVTAGGNPACEGSSITLTTNYTDPTTSGGTYQWRKDGTSISSANSESLTLNGISASDAGSYDLVYNLGVDTYTSNAIALVVNSPVNPSVVINISSGSNPTCSGNAITFTATPTNGGTTPSYQWKKDGVDVGTNSATYTDAGTTAGSITVVMTSSLPCVTSATATSGAINLSVTAKVTPSVSIAVTSGANPTCSGTAVTFTATPTNGGTPTYQWQKDGVNVGTNSATYTDAGTTAGSISVVMTSSLSCVTSSTATSNAISLGVTAKVTPSVSIAITSGSNPTCSGSAITFTATPADGGATPAYQWKKDGINVGTNSATYTDAGTTAGSITVVMTTSLTCITTATATSNAIAFTVTPLVTPSVSIAITSGSNPTCSGTAVTFTATSANGGATATYQWKKDGVNVGTNSATYTDAGTTAGSVTVVMTSSLPCVTSATATSSAIALAVTARATPSVAIAITSGANPTCSGTAVTFTATPTNGGTPTYQWQKDGVNVGTNSATYTDAGTTAGSISVVMTSSLSCVTSSTATSNAISLGVTAKVTPSVSIAITSGSNPTCSGSAITFTATPADGGATPAYQWKKDGINVGTNSATYTDAGTTAGSITVVMTTSLTCITTATATSNAIAFTVTPLVTPSVSIAITSGSNPTCSGTAVTFTATSANGGATATYQWKKDGVNVGTNSATYTDAGTTAGSVTVVMTSSLPCVTSATATSSAIALAVTARATPSVAIAITSGANPTCSGTAVTFTATPTNGGTPTYQWKKDGVNVGTNSATYTDAGTTAGSITVVMTSSLSCVTSSTATSNTINLSVTAKVTPSVSIAVTSGTNPTCSGTAVTFTATPANGGATPAYQWKKDGINVGTNSATYTDAGTTAGSITVVMTTSLTCITTATATSNAIAFTVTPLVTPSVSIAITSGSNPTCSGTAVTFTATSANGGATATYQWKKDGVNVGTNSATYTDAGTTAGSVTVVMTSSLPCVTSATATSSAIALAVTARATPSVAIAITSGANPTCSGTAVTFTATPTNGGTPTYQWKKDGVNVGTNSATYTDAGTTAGSITVVMTSSLSCVTSSTATSNTIDLSVTAKVTPSVSIAVTSGTNPTCSGTAVTFTATPVNGGTPSYQWKKGGANVGTNSATYTDAGTTAGSITVVMTSSLTCVTAATATSNAVALSVNPNTTINSQTTPGNAYCQNATASALMVTAVGTSLTYQWFSNTTALASGGTSISGATTASFTPSTATPGTTYYYVVVSGSCGTVTSAVSGAITVNAAPTASLPADQTICTGTSPANITLSNLVGSVTKWERSTDPQFPGNRSSDVTVTSSTLLGSTIGSLTQTSYFRAYIQNGACPVIQTAYVTVTVNPASSGGTASASQTICAGSTPSNINLSNSIGSVVKWQSSPDAAFTSPIDIANTTTTLTGASIGALTTTTYFRAIVQSGSCNPANSSVVTITVNPLPTLTGASQSASVCAGSTAIVNLTGLLPSRTSTITYTINGGATQTVTGVVANASGTAQFTTVALTAANNGQTLRITGITTTSLTPNCTQSVTQDLILAVAPPSIGGTVSGATTVCASGNSGTLTLTGQTGNVIRWESSLNGTTWTTISNTNTTYDYTNVTTTTQFRAVVQSGSCSSATSTAATITISPASSPGTISGPTSVCYGSGGTLTVSGYTGSILRWESSTDNGASWNSISNTTNTQAFDNLTSSTQYRVAVKSGVCPEAVSPSALSITVNPTPTVGTPTAIQLVSGTEPSCSPTGSPITTYSTSATNSTSLNWSISNTAAGTINATSDGMTMTWADNFSGTVAIQVTADGCGGPSAIVQRYVTINPPYTPTVTSVPPGAVCLGTPVTLNASGFSTTDSIIGGDFTIANPPGWQVKDNSTLTNFPANADNTVSNVWSESNGPRVFNGQNYNSQLGGKFAIVNGNENSTLETPVFSTVGRATAALTFYQAFNLTAGTIARIEISTDGGTTYNAILAQYNPPATFGIPNSGFAAVNIPLTSYLGMSNLRIRFRYNSSGASSWAIDNVNIGGNYQPVTYAWTGPNISGTGATVTATPTTAGANIYNVIASYGGCSNTSTSASVTINVNPLPTASMSISTPSTVCQNASSPIITFTGANGTAPYTFTYNINGGAAQTVMSTSGSSVTISPSTAIAGTFTYNLISVQESSSTACTQAITNQNATVTVNELPAITTNPQSQKVCVAGNATFSVAASGAATYQWQVSTDGGNSFSNISDGTLYSGTTTASLQVINVTKAMDAYKYKVVVTGTSACAPATSVAATLTIPNNDWIGVTSVNWNTGTNWACGRMPFATEDALIPPASSVRYMPTLDSSVTNITNLTLQAGSVVTLNGHIFNINGNVSETGIFSSDANASIALGGTGSGTLYFAQAPDSIRNVIKDLTVNTTGTFTIGNQLYILNELVPKQGTLNANGNLTIRSTSVVATARVAEVGPNAAVIGEVTVERFIPEKRAFRFLSPSVTTSTSINKNWMEGVVSPSYWSGNVNPKPGYGTHITGSRGVIDSLDYNATGYSSLFFYDNLRQAWDSAKNSFSTLKAGIPWRVLVRGSRSVDLSNNEAAPSNTILRAKGILKTGPVVYDNTGANATPIISSKVNDFSFVGNPYASSIDWDTIYHVSQDIAPTYTAWDPMINVRGGYVSFSSLTGTSNIESRVDSNIQSGQGFFVQTAGPNPKLTILEGYKTTSRTQVFRVAYQIPKLSVQLLLNQTAGIQNTADGLVAVFDESFRTEIGDEDSYKFTNLDENLAIDRNGVSLSIEGRPIIKGSDTIPLKMWQFRQKSYFLKVGGVNFSRNVTAFVKDAYLGVETPINLEAGTIIPFSITSDAASSARNRFTIIFKGSKALPVVVTDIKASLKDKGVKVEWTSHTETNIDMYEIERSEDAINFVKQGVVLAKGNNSTTQLYEWLDQAPVTGANFYRIKIIEKSGEVMYTAVVKVDVAKTAGSITVYPNPVRGNTFSVNIKNMEKGRYSIMLYNNAGQIVFNSVINHDGRNTAYPVTTKIISKGSYQLHVSNSNIEKTTLVIFD